MSYLISAISLLLGIAFDTVTTLFVVRLAAEASRADFHNPVSQFVYRTTNPLLAPLRRVLPNWRRINLAALLVCYLLMLAKTWVVYALLGAMPNLAGLLVLALADLVGFLLTFYLVLVFGWALLSMLGADGYHPVLRLVDTLVDPLLRPLRGKLTIGMFDLSPMVVLIALELGQLLITAPLHDLGLRLTAG